MNSPVALAVERAPARGAPDQCPISEKQSIELVLDRDLEALWCLRANGASPSVTLSQLRDAKAIDDKLIATSYGRIGFKLLASRQPGTFSLGGDLAFFSRCIERNDRTSLAEYAVLAARAIWANVRGLAERGVKTIAVVQGESQGGGFEAALSCNTLIAEEGSAFGFPEPLFGMFPGMGGELLLRTRVDAAVARRMVTNSNRYTAEFLHQIGVVDYLVPRGHAIAFATELVRDVRGLPQTEVGARMERREQVLAGLSYADLSDSIERWVDRAFLLEARHLRSMRYIIEMQHRKAG